MRLERDLNEIREFAVLEPPEILGAFGLGFPTLGLDKVQDILRHFPRFYEKVGLERCSE